MAVTLVIALAGCSASEVSPSTSPAAPAPSASAPAPTTAPVLDPAESATENLPYFDFISQNVLTANPEAGGRDFIDALAVGGFDKTQMELTPDRTTVDLAADSVLFSVRFNSECLVGQSGAATGYHSYVAPILASGTCLVGTTRPIDW
ncbi:hypothetical protein GCM10027056_22670 [Glaciibacter psychrotolerans]|nr:hypothetical protein [Leifsonia psychrotolerans]